MILLEIAARGLRAGLPASGRVTLRPGYGVVDADGEAFRALVLWLVMGAPDESLLPHAAGPVRAGATLLAPDRTTWRVLRDAPGGTQLQRWDPASRTFTTVAGDRESVAPALAQHLALPARDWYERWLVLRGEELPSRRAAASAAAAGRVQGRPGARDPGRARARLAELREELERAQRAEELQQRLEATQTRVFKLDEAVRDAGRVRDAHAAAEAQLRGFGELAAAAAALGDVQQRLDAWERASAKRDEALRKIAADRAGVDEEGADPGPWWRQLALWPGLAAGVAALAVGLGGEGTSRYVALLDIPAFGWAAWVCLGWIGRVERRERAQRRRGMLDDWERKAEAVWQRDTEAVRAAIAAAGVQGPAELKDALARLEEARATEAEARSALEAWRASAPDGDAEAERVRAEAELRDVEEALAAVSSGYVREPRSIEQEIARVEAELVGSETVAVAGRVDAPEDAVGALLEAARAPGAPGGDALAAVVARAGQLLGAASERRLGGLQLDGDRMTLELGGRRVATAELAPADLDLCWAALRVCLLERALARGRCCALVDGALDGLREPSRRVLGLQLKAVARAGQIVHATRDPAYRDPADIRA